MPTAPQLDWPQGQPLFEVQLRAVAEGLAGNGVVNAGDLEVTATATDLEIQVAAGTAYYDASEVALSAAETHVLSGGDADYDRWDTVVFDADTGSSAVREGTAEQYPTPPDISGDELLLAIVYVPSGATDVSDSEILDWRAQFSNEAEQTHYDDTTGTYGVATVDAALDELQEAAQAQNYPLLIGADVAPHLAGNDLLDADSGQTIYDQSAGVVPREHVDDERTLTGPVTSNTTTSGEEVVLVDTSSGAVTITLASADLAANGESMNVVTIVDVGGAAETNPITVDTESGEGIDGGTTETVETNYGATVLAADDTQWYTAGGGGGGAALVVQDDGSVVEDPVETLDAQAGLGATSPGTGEVELAYEHQAVFEGRESGSVSDTNQGILVIDSLADGETVEIYKAALTNADGSAVASGVDLELVTLDNSGGFTSQATLLSGDGSTIFDSETGSPLGSYTNSSGGAQTIAVLVDNQSEASVTIMALVEGVTGA